MRFTKMQGVGNDFVVIDTAVRGSALDPQRLAVDMCHRRFGVGADGLLLVTRIGAGDGDAAFEMRMFNPDGTEDMCGNGLRCVSLWAHLHGWLHDRREFGVRTRVGIRNVRELNVDVDGKSGTFGVDMGVPEFEPAAIPYTGDVTGAVLESSISAGGRGFVISSVNTGSTHTVLFGPPPTEADFTHYSPLIEEHPWFPDRTSVLWATVDNRADHRRIAVRIWERAAGETLGCGTGACAVAVIARKLNIFSGGIEAAASRDFETEVVSRGGSLFIRWLGDGHSVEMTGPAAFVYDGDVTA